MKVYLHKTVVETVEDPDCEISAEDAAQYKKTPRWAMKS